jgi:ribonuclease HI
VDKDPNASQGKRVGVLDHQLRWVSTTLSAGAGILVTSPKGESFKYVMQMHFPASKNAAEYEALFHGLRIAMELSFHRFRVLRDSMLVINQANKEWSCLDDIMLLYC